MFKNATYTHNVSSIQHNNLYYALKLYKVIILFLVMRTFKTYSLGIFQIYNTILLIIVAMLYNTSPSLILYLEVCTS